MAHFQLRHLVQGRPHGAKLRRRTGRRLQAIRPSRAVELWYKAELLKVVRHVRALIRMDVFPVLKAELDKPSIGDRRVVGDAASKHVTAAAFNSVANKMGGIDATAKRLANLAAQKSLGEVDKRLAASIKQSVSIDISGLLTKTGTIQTAMAAATQANIDLITSIPAQYLEKAQLAVEKNFVDGMRWEDLAKIIEQTGDVTESRAKLIARDQTSKMNGAFNEVRQTSIGIEEYEWQTSGDERVREEHAANDTKRFRWDAPPTTGHPGEDINCRCVAIPVFDLDKMEQELGT